MKSEAVKRTAIYAWDEPTAEALTTPTETLRECVRESLRAYLDNLGDHEADGLYQMVLQEVEEPLLATLLDYTGGNQTRAASILGISRSTLRKKLAQYRLG